MLLTITKGLPVQIRDLSHNTFVKMELTVDPDDQLQVELVGFWSFGRERCGRFGGRRLRLERFMVLYQTIEAVPYWMAPEMLKKESCNHKVYITSRHILAISLS